MLSPARQHITIVFERVTNTQNTVMDNSMERCDLTSPLDGTIAQTYNPSCPFIGMDDRYSAKKQ